MGDGRVRRRGVLVTKAPEGIRASVPESPWNRETSLPKGKRAGGVLSNKPHVMPKPRIATRRARIGGTRD